MPSVSDEDLDGLVEAAQAGGDWAFGRLWELLSPSVAGYLRGRGIGDVDDVTSEVFLAALTGLPRFTGTGPRIGADFRRWLFTIAHHRGVDDVRRQVRRAPSVAYEPDADPRTALSAEEVVLGGLSAGTLGDLLADLPDDQRDVLLLRVVADLPIDEVSAVLSRSADAVRQLQHRAIVRLRRDLADKGSGAPSRSRLPQR